MLGDGFLVGILHYLAVGKNCWTIVIPGNKKKCLLKLDIQVGVRRKILAIQREAASSIVIWSQTQDAITSLFQHAKS